MDIFRADFFQFKEEHIVLLSCAVTNEFMNQLKEK